MDSEYPEPEAHGGDLAAAERVFGRPAAGWLDLSTGINPTPYPHIEIGRESLARLPTEARLTDLLTAARVYYDVPQDAAITPAAGTQHLIQILPHLLAGGRVAIAGPTYSEHAIVWSRAGRAVAATAAWPDLARADIAVLVNPNNPDGRLIEPVRIAKLADDLAKRQGVVVVDEAFCDVTPGASAAPLTVRGNLIVLRSFGKFFGLAGLRLGFCVSSPAFAARLADALGPWAVSGPALEIGARALKDNGWIADTRSRLAVQNMRLREVLAAAGLEVVGGTDLYCLIDTANAGVLYRRLGVAGILVRRFADQPHRLRFGLPGDDAGFARLAAALAD